MSLTNACVGCMKNECDLERVLPHTLPFPKVPPAYRVVNLCFASLRGVWSLFPTEKIAFAGCDNVMIVYALVEEWGQVSL